MSDVSPVSSSARRSPHPGSARATTPPVAPSFVASGRVAVDAAAPAAPTDSPAEAEAKSLPQAVLTALALMCTMLWAGAQIGVKYGLEVSPPLALMGLRFVAAALLLLPAISLARSPWPRNRAAWGRTLALGVLNNTLYLGITAIGLASVSAGLACVLTGLNPLALAIGGALFFRERVTARTMLGLTGALLGVTFVMAGRLGADNALSGALLIVLANLTMVAGNLLYKRWQDDCGLMVSHAVQLGVGGVTLLAFSVATEPWRAIVWDSRLLSAELFLVFGVSFGAMLTWLFLLSRGSASKAGAFLFLVPLFGLGESALVLGEMLSQRDLVGAFFTTLCIWYAQHSSVEAAPAAESRP